MCSFDFPSFSSCVLLHVIVKFHLIIIISIDVDSYVILAALEKLHATLPEFIIFLEKTIHHEKYKILLPSNGLNGILFLETTHVFFF
jgi:hypothetical protein